MRLLFTLFAVLITAVSLYAQSYPSSFALYSNSPACDGQTFKISVGYSSPPSGTSVSFRWSGPNSFTSTAIGVIQVPASVATAGVYSVTMTFSGTNNGTATASTTVGLGTPKPQALLNYISPEGNSSYTHRYQVCGPTSLSLTATPNQFENTTPATYQWSGPGGFSSNVQNPVVSQGVTGLYIVTATYPNGCGTGKDTITISDFSPLALANSYTTGPNPQFSTAFCPGSSVEFRGGTSTIPAGTTVTYQWSGPNGFTSNAQSFTLNNLTTAMTGSYSVTTTFSGACSATATASRSIQVGAPSVSAYSSVAVPGGSGGYSFSSYCPGTDVRVDAFPSSGVAYQWSGPNGFTSSAQSFTLANLSSAQSGAYSVTVTASGGCSNTAVATVGVGTPILYVDSYTVEQNYSNATSFCPGSSARFLADISGSTATYRWSGPNGFTSTAQSFTLTNLTPAMAGTYSVTATLTGACSGTVLTKTKTIQVGPPSVFAGSGLVGSNGVSSFSTFCSGTDVQVYASPSNAQAYQWRGPNGFTSSAQSFTLANLTTAMAGAYSVTVTVTNGCSNTAVATVAIGPPIVYITSRPADNPLPYSTAFCPGAAFQVSAFNPGGTTATYQWRGPNGFTSTAPSFTLTNATAAMTGLYSVTATFTGTCSGTATSSVYIRVGANTPVVTASTTFIAPNQPVTLLASGCDANYEQTVWSTGATGNTLIVTPAQSMTYSAVCRIIAGGCSGTASNVISVTVTNAPPVDLRIAMQLSTRTPDVNKPVVVTVFLENRSNQDATGVQWRCRLPGAVAFVAREPGVVFFEGVVTGNPAMIAANSTLPFSFTIMPTANATFRLASQITASDNPDPEATPDYGTNSGQKYVATVDFRTPGATNNLVFSSPEPNPAQLPPVASNQPVVAEGFSDLSLGIQTSTLTPALNGEMTVTIKVASRGYYFEEQAQVRCQLPPGMSFVSSSDFTASGNVLTSANRTVYSYSATTLTFRARVSQPGQATIQAEIFSAGRPDPDSTPNNGYDNGEDDTAQISLRTGGL